MLRYRFGTLGRAAALALAALVTGCGHDSGSSAFVQPAVVKGPVFEGRVCALRIDDAGAVATEPSGCERLDASGRALLALAESSRFLLVASELRYGDESADGAPASFDGVLEAVVATPAAGPAQVVAITPLTHVAVSSLRERGFPLSGPEYESMLDRVAAALSLSPAEVRAVPAFGSDGQPADRAAATIAAFSDLGRDQGTGVSAQIDRFVREFAKLHVDDALLQFNEDLGAAVATRLQLNPNDPTQHRIRVYGYVGTSGPAAAIDGERRCFARAHGLWTAPLTFGTAPANFSLCISRAPAGANCDAAFLRGLDFSGITVRGANSSWEVVLRAALRAFTSEMGQYRLEFSATCESFPTLEATQAGGKLYYPHVLAPTE